MQQLMMEVVLDPENGDYVLSFDGIDDWVDISNSSTLDVNGNELTIIAKVKVEGFPSMSQVVVIHL